MVRWCVLVALAAIAVPAFAGDIYKWVDADGGIHFADRPPGDGSAVEIDSRAPPRIHSLPPPALAPVTRSRPTRRRPQVRRRTDRPARRCETYRRHIRLIERRMRHGYAEPAGNRWRARKRKWTERLYRECYF